MDRVVNLRRTIWSTELRGTLLECGSRGIQTRRAKNLKKHSVDFREAATAFDDTLSTSFADPDHSVGEARFLTIGVSKLLRILVVAQTESGGTRRIIGPVGFHFMSV
jgi:uncharacterized DUF497 family protein